MASASEQDKLDRVRRPRVQIKYKVETNGAMVMTELPFVVGVMADISAQTQKELGEVKDRPFVEIDRDNINQVLAGAAPRLAMKVQDKLTGEDNQLAIELNFREIKDFDPDRVARQVGPLRELLEMRERLTQLQTKMEGNDKLERLLKQVLSNTEQVITEAKKIGIGASPAGAEAPKPEGSQ